MFLRTAFALVDPKSVKDTEDLTELLHFWDARVKAVRRMLMKLSPSVNLIEI